MPVKRVGSVGFGLWLVLSVLGVAQPTPAVQCAPNSQEARCQLPSARWAGRIGTGPAFNQGGLYDSIQGGEIRGHTLYAAVEYGARGDAPDARLGAVLAVDLRSGDRRLISGEDLQGHARGRGPGLNGVRDVAVLGDGSLLVSVDPRGLAPLTLLRVDPASGRRTLLWASRLDAAPAGQPGLCPNTAGRTLEAARPDPTFAHHAGNVYLSSSDNPAGNGWAIYRLNLKTRACTLLSAYGERGRNRVGSGAAVPQRTGLLSGLSWLDGALYYTSFPDDGLVRVDPVSGARRLLSSRAKAGSYPAVGRGPDDVAAGFIVRLGQATFISSARPGQDFAAIQRVGPHGSRRPLALTRGPASGAARDGVQPLFTDGRLLYLGLGRALLAVNPRSGASWIVSE